MRKVLAGMIVLAAIVVAGWLWAETRLVEQARTWIATEPAIDAAAVQPLRDPRRLGLRLQDPVFRDPVAQLSLPWARLSLAPLSPTTARLDLPEQGRLTLAGREHDLTMRNPGGSLRLSPLNRMAPDRLNLSMGEVSLAGQALARQVQVEARLSSLRGDAPDAAGAAYDLDLWLDGLRAGTLADAGLDLGPLPDPVSVQGQLRLWLDAAPSLRGQTPPQVVGWQAQELILNAGPLALRVAGRITRDRNGLVQGQVVLYSRDADQMLQMAAQLGLIPPQAQLLLRAGLAQLSQVVPDTDLPGPVYAEPAEGEMRLPIVMRDGQLILAGVPVGRAPQFAP